MASQNKLRTSREVYHRIKWDPSFEENLYVIGVKERFAGMVEVPLVEFVPDGEIPWHRVWYFAKGRERVWDRESKLDHIFGSGNPPKYPNQSLASNGTSVRTRDPLEGYPKATPLTGYTYCHQQQAWTPLVHSNTNNPEASKELSFITWNILFDWYDANLIYSEERWVKLLDLLGQTQADVIALQEVVPAFHALLAKQVWVRDSYVLSDSLNGPTVSPQGTLFLVKGDARFYRLSFSTSKQAVICKLGDDEHSMVVSNVHLSSNREDHPQERRLSQMEELLAQEKHPALSSCQNWLVLGDFNTRKGEPLEEFMRRRAFEDVGLALAPEAHNYTFIPSDNTLAALNSRSGRPGRLDRMYLKSSNSDWRAKELSFLGTSPYTHVPEPRFLSDHWGVQVKFQNSDESNVSHDVGSETTVFWTEPSYHSACMVSPPEELWESIQTIREEFDPSYERWMPHINLLFGFVPEAYFDGAEAAVQDVLSTIEPFTVTLREFRWFEHKKTMTCWLEPETEPPGMLRYLQAAIQESFPTCNDQSEKSEHGFTPHLTVAKFRKSKREEAIAHQRKWSSNWTPITWKVDAIHFISRGAETPFSIKKVLPLGQTNTSLEENQAMLADSTKTVSDEFEQLMVKRQSCLLRFEEVWALLNTQVRACMDEMGASNLDEPLQAYGSFAMGAAIPQSDLDSVWFVPSQGKVEAYGNRLLHKLQETGELSYSRWQRSQRGERLLFEWMGYPFDVAFLPEELSSFVEPPSTPWDQQTYLSFPSALQGLSGTSWLQSWLVERGLEELFSKVLWLVRYWAASHGLSGKAFGYLSGYSWSIWVAWGCEQALLDGLTEPADVFAFLMKSWANWDSDTIVSLTEVPEYSRDSRREHLVILSPFGLENLARSLTATTWARFKQLASSSFAQLQQFSWRSALQVERLPQHAWVFSISNHLRERNFLEEWKGHVSGSLLGSMIALERQTRLLLYPMPPWTTRPTESGWTATLNLVAMAGDDMPVSERQQSLLLEWASRFL